MKNVFEAFLGGSAKFIRLTMKTDVSKKMAAKVRNELAGKGGKIYSIKTVAASANWDYGRVVNNRLEREDKAPEFSPLPSWGTAYGQKGSALFYKTTDPNLWYFRYYNPSTLSEAYYINDRQATPDEVQTIKEAFYKKSEGRQGLSKENTVNVRMVKFANLTELHYQGVNWDLTIPQEIAQEVAATVEA